MKPSQKGLIDDKTKVDIPRKFTIEVLIQLWVDFIITTNPLYDFSLTLLRRYVGNNLLQGKKVNECGGVSFAHGANGFLASHKRELQDIRSFLPETFEFGRFAKDVLQDKFDVQALPSFAQFMKGSNHAKILDSIHRCNFLGRDDLPRPIARSTDKDDDNDDDEEAEEASVKQEIQKMAFMKRKATHVFSEFMKCLRGESGKFTPAMRAQGFAIMLHLGFIVNKTAITNFSINKKKFIEWLSIQLEDTNQDKKIVLKYPEEPAWSSEQKKRMNAILRAMAPFIDTTKSGKRKAESDDGSTSTKKAKLPPEPFCIQPSGSTDDADDTTMTSSYQGLDSEDELIDIDDDDDMPSTPRKNLCPTMDDQYLSLTAKSTSSTKTKPSRRAQNLALLASRKQAQGVTKGKSGSKNKSQETPKRGNKKANGGK